MNKLTVIVTIYKVEGYLEKCLDSILNQTFKEFQVFLVVGSNDEVCTDICKKYAKKDSRFTTIVLEPRGLSDARNVGIQKTKTEYITFVDGDDYLVDTAFDTLMKCIQGCDIAIGNYLVDDGDKKIKSKGIIREGFYSKYDALVGFLNGDGTRFVVAWGKIYKTSLFKKNKVSYPLGKLHEDNLTTYKLLYHAQKINYTNTPVYVYVNRTDSLSKNINTDKERVVIEDLPNLRKYLEPIEGLTDNINDYEIMVIISYMVRLARSSKDNYGEYFRCMKELKGKKIYKSQNLRTKMKILCAVMINLPRLSFSLLRI